MLVTYVGDLLMLTVSICWWQDHCDGDLLKIKSQSPTTQNCHQNELSSTDVIDVVSPTSIKSVITVMNIRLNGVKVT